MNAYDLVIRGGRVIDGSGAAEKTADLAIRDGEIAAVGTIRAKGHQEIDATGALVTPGFVDIHTHYDGQASWSSRMKPSSHHGVTTALMGNCGVGFAPVKPGDREMLVQLMEGVEDIPEAVLHDGLPWTWESFPDYLDFLSERSFDMDLAAQLPHAALRVFVMGERGANREPADADDIAAMRCLTTEAIQSGAFGFSSSRTLNHRSSTGAPTPSLTAAREELVGIGLGVRDAGSGVLEMISDFKDLDPEFDMLMAMVEASQAPMSISLAQGLNPQGWKKLLGKIDRARASGLVVKGQVAPRAVGILLGLTTTMNPFSAYPAYREISHLPLPERVARMRSPGFKEELLSQRAGQRGTFILNDWHRMWSLDEAWDYEPLPGLSIEARAQRLGESPESLVFDLLLDQAGKQLLYTPFVNYAEYNLDCCREMILADNTVMGLGDGGAHVGTICDASFITYLLIHWGRDRKRGELIDLPTLVKAQTRDTAMAVGLSDRGLLIPGKKADINLIDFDNLKIELPQVVRDLPGGGARLEQKTTGLLATIVAGQVTYQQGEATEDLPGRLLRGAR